MKTLKTFEDFAHEEDEKYPYPKYHEILLQYLPSAFLFSDYSDLPEYDYMQTFTCDINDLTSLSDDDIKKTYANFAVNAFNDNGIDFLRKVETQSGDRFDKILVGGIPTPRFGANPKYPNIHGDLLYFFGEETDSNTEFLKDLCEHYNEFDYYDGFYRVWWD